jgi:YVTN family beta-propeller protein
MTKRLLITINFFFFSLLVGQKIYAQHVYAYITNSASDNMSVVDVSTNTVISTVSIGAGATPYAVAILPNGIAYVADTVGTVTIYNTASNSIIGTIAVDAGPLSIVANPSGSTVYVTNTTAGSVSVINTTTNTVTATIDLNVAPTNPSTPSGIVVSPDGSTVYVADYAYNNISVIDAATNTVTTTFGTGSSTLPRGLAITPDGQYLYVTNSNAGTVGVYKTSDNSLVTNIAVGGGPFGIAISPDGTTAYVTNTGSSSVSVINTTTNTVTTTIPEGGGNQPLGVSFTPDGSTVYVVNYGANNVSVINTGTNTITNTIVVGTKPTSFSNFIASVAVVLPVQFTSFTAQELSNHTIQLNWQVQDQTSGTFYEIQRSNDGASFSKKTLVNASSSSAGSYSWIDVAPSAGANFYRIKSVETSGKITYSQILRVNVGNSDRSTFIYPNPVKDHSFTLQLNNQPQGLYSVELINILGQRIFSTQLNYTGGSSAQTINLPQFVSRGNYQVIVRNGSVQNVLKLIVE